MRKKHRLLFAAVLTAMVCLFALPSASFAEDHPIPAGHKHVDVDIYEVPGDGSIKAQASYPAKLDPRSSSWYKNSIRVRNQADTNLCWAFSATSASQISYAKETGRTVPELSPVHLGYFFYNRVDDPLHGTAGDKNLDNTGWIDDGNSCVYTQQHMATWSGLGLESVTPFKVDPSGEEYIGPEELDDSLAYHNGLVLQNSTYYNSGDADTLKSVVSKYGAAVVSLRFGKSYKGETVIPLGDYLYEEKSFYNPDGYQWDNNHEVTVVGWDDNYSKDNFSSRKHNSKTYEPSKKTYQPENDGAWIVMNSWGDDWGDKGYFYVSYDSLDILGDGILGLDMQPVDSAVSNKQYDGNACSYSASMEKGEAAANVFTAPDNKQIRIDRVQFTEYNDGTTKYDLEVYTGLSDPADPDSGILAYQTQLSTDTPGIKTFDLASPVTVDKGETYSVVIRYKAETHAGVESYGRGFEAGLAKGQSFYFQLGKAKWTDAKSSDICFRIKAFSRDTYCQHTNLTPGDKVAPTKSSEGYTPYVCKSCGHTQREDIVPMLDPIPDPTTLKSLTAGKKAITVKWKKSNEVIRDSNITGYQIQYSKKSNMKAARKVTVKGYTKTSKKVGSLKSGTKYYVQVRTYYKDKNGKNWYSDWSEKMARKAK